jgi:hypothetical protein
MFINLYTREEYHIHETSWILDLLFCLLIFMKKTSDCRRDVFSKRNQSVKSLFSLMIICYREEEKECFLRWIQIKYYSFSNHQSCVALISDVIWKWKETLRINSSLIFRLIRSTLFHSLFGKSFVECCSSNSVIDVLIEGTVDILMSSVTLLCWSSNFNCSLWIANRLEVNIRNGG